MAWKRFCLTGSKGLTQFSYLRAVITMAAKGWHFAAIKGTGVFVSDKTQCSRMFLTLKYLAGNKLTVNGSNNAWVSDPLTQSLSVNQRRDRRPAMGGPFNWRCGCGGCNSLSPAAERFPSLHDVRLNSILLSFPSYSVHRSRTVQLGTNSHTRSPLANCLSALVCAIWTASFTIHT